MTIDRNKLLSAFANSDMFLIIIEHNKQTTSISVVPKPSKIKSESTKVIRQKNTEFKTIFAEILEHQTFSSIK